MEAEPALSQLRAAGHEVSLVEDVDEAQVILKAGRFDQCLVLAGRLLELLEERTKWASVEADEWRNSVAALAHDIQNLLTAMERALAALKKQRTALGPAQEMEGLQHSILSLSAFLRELAAELAGEEAQGHITTIDLEDLLEAAAMTVYPSAASRGQRLAIDVDESVKTARTDGRKIRRILMKILQYASNQSSEMGLVTVRAWRDQDDCVIAVSLPGRDVTRAELRRLFSPANGAAARSLAYEQKLVDQVGGRLWIESQREGTSVFVSFPVETVHAATLREG